MMLAIHHTFVPTTPLFSYKIPHFYNKCKRESDIVTDISFVR